MLGKQKMSTRGIKLTQQQRIKRRNRNKRERERENETTGTQRNCRMDIQIAWKWQQKNGILMMIVATAKCRTPLIATALENAKRVPYAE